jgi:stage V sporulation protein D (sporulation-specific penicillin-binding protein)
MSHRTAGSSRFLILRLFILSLGLILLGRVVQIQVFRHEELAARAKDLWTDDVPLPADRGNIYDRNGRPLALSVTRWQVGVARSQIKNTAELAQKLADILDLDRASLQKRLGDGQGHLVLAKNVALGREEKLSLESMPAVTLEDLRSRIYPFDGLGASVIGTYRHSQGQHLSTGMEKGLDPELAGHAGLARTIKRAGSSESLGNVMLQNPVHGRSLVLSLDADLQAICETHLAAAVKDKNAKGGSLLVLDPQTGDVLAAASWPLLESRGRIPGDQRIWQNTNFTGVFEPGSVFKIFSTASLMRNGAIDTSTVFDCSNGDIGSCVIRNDDGHKYGNLPLMRAFSKSSNIYFARAVGNLSNEEFYRDLVDFGFGQKTTLPYPGQADGILHNPTRWSDRSRPTLSIGQEMAATPLQLAMALGAVANGGTLYAPRLVREVRDHEGNILETRDPVPLRRVMSEPLAGLLREAMRRVVAEGTAQGARTDWIETGGKTGTAQKVTQPGQGYAPGAYVASFAGLVPVDQPRLVILAVLDEPQGYRQYYAAQSAVPLFSQVVHDIRQSTDWLDDVPGGRTAPLAQAPSVRTVRVPDVIHLNVDKAAGRLARAGLGITGTPGAGVVVEQVPAAGSQVPFGQMVRLSVAARATEATAPAPICPDFLGLSNRQVRSLAARLGVVLDLAGQGYVVKQDPPPGTTLKDRRISVRMEGAWR